jgi:hypothetical protein
MQCIYEVGKNFKSYPFHYCWKLLQIQACASSGLYTMLGSSHNIAIRFITIMSLLLRNLLKLDLNLTVMRQIIYALPLLPHSFLEILDRLWHSPIVQLLSFHMLYFFISNLALECSSRFSNP